MDIPLGYVITTITALAGAVTVLWRVSQSRANEVKKALAAQIKAIESERVKDREAAESERKRDRALLEDAVKRIRDLEDARRCDAERYGHEMKAVAVQFRDSIHEVSQILTEMRREIRELNRRPCMYEMEPHDAPKPHSERTTEIKIGPRPSNGG